MKVVIMAGGLGTRISEESHLRPKPMIEIAEKPILWHIMKIFEIQGFNEFIICLGYKGIIIKEYFMNYYAYNSDVTVNLGDNSFEVHRSCSENFKVTLVETGLYTGTSGRLKKVRNYLGNSDFMMTYGDGVADINLKDLLKFHNAHDKVATVTAVQPTGRFGLLSINDKNQVTRFKEKVIGDGGWINGGFFILRPIIFDYLSKIPDDHMLEESVFDTLANRHQLMAYYHKGFWKCMDALRDKQELEDLWRRGQAAWKIWE